jgi:glycosyltransferase involved in cell wall biosynthesis
MGYLCKYLRQAGHETLVLTEQVNDRTFAFLKAQTPVIYINFYKSKSICTRMKVLLLDFFFNAKNRRFCKEALRQTAKQPFDVILCSTCRTFPLPAALKVAQKTGIPLIVDIRDVIEQYTGNEFIATPLPKLAGLENGIAAIFRKSNLKQRNRVLPKAKAVTTVSPWHVEILKRYNPNTFLIYNGYDPAVFYPEPVACNRFYITYTGRLLSLAMRNPELLFQAVQQLGDEQVINPDDFRIRWFTDEHSQKIIRREAGKYRIAAFMTYSGYVSATQIPRILNESSLILILTGKAGSAGPQGIMTTKFFEALAVEKPVLCVQGDEGCLEQAIHDTRAGLSAHNATEVYEYIKNHYLHWRETGHVVSQVNRSAAQTFSRKEQAGRFIRIFQKTRHANG